MTKSNCSMEQIFIECLLDAKALCQLQGKGIRKKHINEKTQFSSSRSTH